MSAEAEFLTATDIAALTGKSQAKHQVAELERRGIPFLLGAQGRPQVSRHHTRMIATGQEVRQSGDFNWSAVK